jgi:hypothetical protein
VDKLTDRDDTDHESSLFENVCRPHDAGMRTLNATIKPLRIVLGAGVAAFGLAACGAAHSPPSSRPPTEKVTMQEFAFIFRPTRTIDPKELPRRNAVAREWALARQSDGILAAASPLEDEGMKITQDGVTRVADPHAVVAVLVIRARDLAAAVGLAQGHPGLAFGREIEVRPVKPVSPSAP